MRDLPVPVQVDAETGIWSVDGQPMVLIPRHFWVFLQMSSERHFGVEETKAAILHATYDAARLWCQRESETHQISGVEVFLHYLNRIGQRGLGQFFVETLDPVAGTASIRLDHSVYVAEYGLLAGRKVCHMFRGAISGGLEFACIEAGHPQLLATDEVSCRSAGQDECRFHVRPLDGPAGLGES